MDFSTKVTIEGKNVAIKGASFKSIGDIASKGTGGGIVSMNVEGPTTFIAPGSMDVKIEGKNVQLLGDQMLNNCGPAGSPANAATMMGVIHAPGGPGVGGNVQPCPGHEVGDVKYPDTDQEFKDRRNALARDHSPGGEHEHKAAQHNESGILRMEGALRRDNPSGPKKSAVSGKDKSQKIVPVCKHCGAVMDGEADHAVQDKSGKNSLVEGEGRRGLQSRT